MLNLTSADSFSSFAHIGLVKQIPEGRLAGAGDKIYDYGYNNHKGDITVISQERLIEMESVDYCRKGDWNFCRTNVFNADGKIISYKSMSASFRHITKDNRKGYLHKYKIIINDSNKILWIGQYADKQYFIAHGEKIYALVYEHKHLSLFPNISSEYEYFDVNNNGINDNLIKKYRKNIGWHRHTDIENARKVFEEEKIGVSVSLDEHFEKGFFYKGFKWNRTWEDLFGYDYITIMIDFTAKNNMFLIEIENVTYPFYGQVLLDLNELKIVEAKKIFPSFDIRKTQNDR